MEIKTEKLIVIKLLCAAYVTERNSVLLSNEQYLFQKRKSYHTFLNLLLLYNKGAFHAGHK